MMGQPVRLFASVSPRTRARVQELAASEGVSVSKLTASLIREALDARAAERDRMTREFAFPVGLWMQAQGLDG